MSEFKISTWGLIEVKGPEAGKFLHSQLTNSVEQLPEGTLRLAGFCTAKGRLLGTFFVWASGEHYYLLCKRDAISALAKRLTMFKLRSKCEITDISHTIALHYASELNQAPMSVKKHDSSVSLAIRPLAGHTQCAGLTVRFDIGEAHAVETTTQTDETTAQVGDSEFEVALQALGIAYVSAATQDMFLPQAINFDLVGGIHFEKGCYPGQEVVARSHYIGKVKRRAFLAALPDADASIHPGQDIWMTGKTNEPAGQIITCAHHGGQAHLLIELVAADGLNEAASYSLHSGDSDQTFSVTPPPYDVLAKGSQFE